MVNPQKTSTGASQSTRKERRSSWTHQLNPVIHKITMTGIVIGMLFLPSSSLTPTKNKFE
jgi:hypothetical protein